MRKHITFDTYKNIKAHLADWLDANPKAYDWLFETINGRKYGEHGEHTYVTMKEIHQIWDSSAFGSLLRLAIICHYKGHIVDYGKHTSVSVENCTITLIAEKIRKRNKEVQAKKLESYCEVA